VTTSRPVATRLLERFCWRCSKRGRPDRCAGKVRGDRCSNRGVGMESALVVDMLQSVAVGSRVLGGRAGLPHPPGTIASYMPPGSTPITSSALGRADPVRRSRAGDRRERVWPPPLSIPVEERGSPSRRFCGSNSRVAAAPPNLLSLSRVEGGIRAVLRGSAKDPGRGRREPAAVEAAAPPGGSRCTGRGIRRRRGRVPCEYESSP